MQPSALFLNMSRPRGVRESIGFSCHQNCCFYPTLDPLPGYLRDTAYEQDPWAYAEIACSGRVFVDMRGVRAEHARLVCIALPGSGWPGQTVPGEASRMLRDRYGVPVGGAECVPQWLTANVRPGGPPPTARASTSISRV
jgi:hypothetical protein